MDARSLADYFAGVDSVRPREFRAGGAQWNGRQVPCRARSADYAVLKAATPGALRKSK